MCRAPRSGQWFLQSALPKASLGDGAQRVELFFEAKNLFNAENIAGVNRVVTTDALGNPLSPLVLNGRDYPDAGKSGYDQRIMQLGFKYSF